jgi:hypothetical protein
MFGNYFIGYAMNEQIEKLFDQALEEFKVENEYATIVVPDPLQRDFVEKFAQLIVRECATLAYDGPNGILEHFGVEE